MSSFDVVVSQRCVSSARQCPSEMSSRKATKQIFATTKNRILYESPVKHFFFVVELNSSFTKEIKYQNSIRVALISAKNYLLNNNYCIMLKICSTICCTLCSRRARVCALQTFYEYDVVDFIGSEMRTAYFVSLYKVNYVRKGHPKWISYASHNEVRKHISPLIVSKRHCTMNGPQVGRNHQAVAGCVCAESFITSD